MLVVVSIVALAPLAPAGAAGSSTAPRASWQPPRAYWRPVIVDGQTFPVARSNYLSLVEFVDDWHAVRLRLVDGTWKPVGYHEGVDITAEPGTPVVSMTDGVVEHVGWLFYSGTRVGVRGADGRYYFYAHLSSVAPSVAPGRRVTAGQLLGAVGNTGYGPPGHRDSFPAHLHVGIQSGSEWINPYPTFVRLYRAATERAARDEASMARLAAGGDRPRWEALARRLFTTFGLP